MATYEKLGVFYLGKLIDSKTGKTKDDYLLYDSKDLTTHAVCVGMTGSGKTGLGISLIEEAALDKIPAIVIDPKGDLSDLLLTFPELSSEEFKPWIDPSEAEKNEMSVEKYSQYISKQWKDGLKSFDETPERIKNFRNSVDLTIYTPASNSGIPISILNSFAAPSKEQLKDSEGIRDKIQSTTSSLLGLLGISVDPLKSKEHILISTIIKELWEAGKDIDLPFLIQQVQNPPFNKIGALDINTFYPTKERLALSVSLNNLLASPGFQAWMEGEPLDIHDMLHSKKGKPKLSIISIAHLSDTERMFFVTLLLNEFISWMRRQPGTSSLRAILYMDEIFGFFPPTASPPSKLPMLTLLKQARAYGISIVLVTQNPVDLDYKGLSNCGTWFIGKLQTERDKARVLEGLKVASNGEIDTKSLNKLLAMTGKRKFIMRSIYEKDTLLFETRWTLSYLKGPLTLAQIAKLVEKKSIRQNKTSKQKTKKEQAALKPNIPPGIQEFYALTKTSSNKIHYEPRILGMAKLHYVDKKNDIDTWQEICVALPVEDDGSVNWKKSENLTSLDSLAKTPSPNCTYANLPLELTQQKTFQIFEKTFTNSLYQNLEYSLYQDKDLHLISKVGESESDFKIRVAHTTREKRDEIVKKLRDKYSDKTNLLVNRIKKAQEKMSEKKQKAGRQKIDTLLSFGSTLLGAFFGKGLTKGTISKTETSIRRASKISRDSEEASQAEEEFNDSQKQLEELEAQMNKEIGILNGNIDPEAVQLESIVVKPRKSDILVEKIGLVWWPTE